MNSKIGQKVQHAAQPFSIETRDGYDQKINFPQGFSNQRRKFFFFRKNRSIKEERTPFRFAGCSFVPSWAQITSKNMSKLTKVYIQSKNDTINEVEERFKAILGNREDVIIERRTGIDEFFIPFEYNSSEA